MSVTFCRGSPRKKTVMPDSRRGSRRVIAALGLCLMLPGVPVAAELSVEQELRYRALLEELRCLVCQNQTLAESDAELAGDLRERVKRMIKEGADDEAILSFMTGRYGDFVHYRPPLAPRTYLLWLAPVLLLAALLAAVLRFVAVRAKREPSA